MALSFNDYNILRRIQEVYPGIFNIVRGNVIFNENDVPTGLPQTVREKRTSIYPQNQITIGHSSVDSSIRDDYTLLKELAEGLQDDEIKRRLNKFIDNIFAKGAYDPAKIQPLPDNLKQPDKPYHL